MSSGHCMQYVYIPFAVHYAATITVNRVQAEYIDVYSLYSFIVRFHE